MKRGKSWCLTVMGVLYSGGVIGVETVTIGKRTYKNCFHIVTQAVYGHDHTLPSSRSLLNETTKKNDCKYRKDSWEAPKLGLVKAESDDGASKTTLTLREFKPAK